MFPKISLQDIQAFLKTERALLLLCMSIALVFWLLVQLSQPQKTKLKVPIIFEVPKGQILSEKPPQFIFVTFKSKGWNLFYRSFRGQPKKLVWSITKDERLSYEDLKDKIAEKISDKVEIENISPNELKLKLERLLRKQVPITVNANVQTVTQFQLSNTIQLLPDTITITGPESTIKKIETVKTKMIDVSELRQNKYGEIQLSAQQNKQVKCFPEKVNYMMTIEQFSEKSLLVPVKLETDSNVTLKLLPEFVKVSCILGLGKYDDLSASDFELIADARGLDLAKTDKLLVKLKTMPTGVRNIKIIPRMIDFVIVTNESEKIVENENQ